jgi:hypothetical protein
MSEKIKAINKIKYRNIGNIEMELGIWSFEENNWISVPKWIEPDDERRIEISDRQPVIFRKNLLGAMHPGLKCAIGEIPSDKSILKDSRKASQWVRKMQEGIPVSPTSNKRLYLDIAGNSRTHGRGLYTLNRRKINGVFSNGIGELYFGTDNNMGFINYGSILLTELLKVVEAENVTIGVVDEEKDDGHWRHLLGVGDSHGRCSYEILRMLTRGVEKVGNNVETPLQIRLGVRNKMVWKGTVLGFPDNKFPDGIPPVDIILPLSGMKGKKLKHGKFYKENIFIGLVHPAENRPAKGSQQLWQWFTPQAIKKDILPGIIDECIELSQALDNPIKIAKVLSDVEKSRLDESFDGSWDETTETDEQLEQSETDDKYKDPVVEILAADKRGVLLQHPWIVNKVKDRLGKRWRRLALNSAIRFRSFMGIPDDDIPDRCFVAKDIPEGWHIFYRNPILHWGSIKLLKSIKPTGGKWDHYLKQNGAVAMSHKTAALVQGDFDGDFYNVYITPEESTGIVEKYANPTADFSSRIMALYWDDKDEHFMANLKPFEAILCEMNLFDLIYEEEPIIEKPSKVKIEGDLEWVFVRSMDSMTGVIANLIQHARANGTITHSVQIPIHDMRTNEYDTYEEEEAVAVLDRFGNLIGETLTTVEKYHTQDSTIVKVLSQQLQIAVDRLKNSLYHNEKGIEACRKIINSAGKPAWLDQGKYKNKNAYIHFELPVGTLVLNPSYKTQLEMGMKPSRWIPAGIGPDSYDSVSLMIATVNEYWREYDITSKPAMEFREFFPTSLSNRSFDKSMEEYALTKHLWFGTAMGKAGSIGIEPDGSDPNQSQFIDIRKKELTLVMTQARRLREIIEAKSAERQAFFDSASDPEVAEESLFYVWSYHPQPNGVRQKESGASYDGDQVYFPTTSFDWASAFWAAGHSPGSQGTAAFAFNIYQDEIVKRLKQDSTQLQVLELFNSNMFPLGDYIYGDPDVFSASQSVRDEKPTRSLPVEGNEFQTYIPSQVDFSTETRLPRDYMNGGYVTGTTVPNTFHLRIVETPWKINKSRKTAITHYYGAEIRAINPNSSKTLSAFTDWRMLGLVGFNSTVPDLGRWCFAQVYTIESYPSNFLDGPNLGDSPVEREIEILKGQTKKVLVGPEAFRSDKIIIRWRYLDESETPPDAPLPPDVEEEI